MSVRPAPPVHGEVFVPVAMVLLVAAIATRMPTELGAGLTFAVALLALSWWQQHRDAHRWHQIVTDLERSRA